MGASMRAEYREFSIAANPIQRRHCPQCQSFLVLTSIDFSPSQFDFRTFKCGRCGHLERVAVAVERD
jgi:hypothetical protein